MRVPARAVTLGDQVLSSVSNVLAVVLVARALGADDFGRFALGYAVLTVVLSLSRAYLGTQVSLAPTVADARSGTAALLGALTLLSPAIAGLVLAVSVLAAGSSDLATLVIVSLAAPVVCLQDIVRSGVAASAQPWAAFVSDAVWVGVMAAPFLVGADPGATAALLLWLGGAGLALVVILVLARQRPDLRGGLRAVRTRHTMGASVALGTAVNTLGSFWLLLVVSRSIGPEATGALRGAATTMGPVNVLINFAGLGLTPALVRRPRSQDLRFCLRTGAAMLTLTAGWVALLLLLPRSAGEALLGDSWSGVRHVLGLTGAEYLVTCVTTAALLGLKVRDAAAGVRRLRLTSAALAVAVGTPVALLADDVRAVAAVLVLAAAGAATVGWVQLVGDLRRGGAAR